MTADDRTPPASGSDTLPELPVLSTGPGSDHGSEPGLPERQFGWWDMWVSEKDDPRSQDNVFGERDTLVTALDDRRLTLRMKCEGLDAEAMARRSVPPSNLSLLGLLRHLAANEQIWFRIRLAGQDVPMLYRAEDGTNLDFDGAVADEEMVRQAWDDWKTEVAFAEEFVATTADLGTIGAEGEPVRQVMVHLIEEYARHLGHADLIRERIDGRVGQ